MEREGVSGAKNIPRREGRGRCERIWLAVIEDAGLLGEVRTDPG